MPAVKMMLSLTEIKFPFLSSFLPPTRVSPPLPPTAGPKTVCDVQHPTGGIKEADRVHLPSWWPDKSPHLHIFVLGLQTPPVAIFKESIAAKTHNPNR